MIKSVAITTLICFLLAIPGAAQIESIGIVSKWSGLGKREESVLVISKNDNKYYTADGREIAGKLVAELERAVYAPEVPVLNFGDLGITQAWLDRNAAPAFPECCTYDGIWATAKQKQLFNRIFRDKSKMEKIIGDYLTGETHTDDYPCVEITINSPAGTRKLSSEKQMPLMLPWKIEGSSQSGITYNAAISRAIVDLLPAKFTNRDKLSGGRLRPDVSVIVMDKVFEAERSTIKKRN